MYRGRICWVSSKVITRIINWGLRSSEIQHRQSSPRGTLQNSGAMGVGCCFQQKTCNISETGQCTTKVTIDDQQEVACVLSIGAKINNFGWLSTAITHPVSKYMRFQRNWSKLPTTKIWMKTDQHYQRQRCSAMALVSGNKVYRDIRGGSLEGASDDIGVIECRSPFLQML